MGQLVDHYKILQVNFGAEKDDVTAAYRRLCKAYHPDLNPTPEAEEMMKRLNLAYAAVCEDQQTRESTVKKRQQWKDMSMVRRAHDCVNNYFSALTSGDYAAAYELISDYDKAYVTLSSFCEWRKSVQRLFTMKEFNVSTTGTVVQHELSGSESAPAIRHIISIVEKNVVLQTTDSYNMLKMTILERDNWKVFLGYRDLNEIAKIFEDLSLRQEKGEMTRHWEQYCSTTCRELNMLNLSGLLSRANAELYRCRRYKQQMVIACFRVKVISPYAEKELNSELVEASAKAISEVLRETDIPAYLGNGVFAVLLVELRKKHAELITKRITNKLKNDVHRALRTSILAECSYLQYEGGGLREYIDTCLRFESN